MSKDVKQQSQFEKFMDDIVKRESTHRENAKVYAEEHADTPQRKYNKLYRERWQNRIVWSSKRNDK
jgi:hypothetical protein